MAQPGVVYSAYATVTNTYLILVTFIYIVFYRLNELKLKCSLVAL